MDPCCAGLADASVVPAELGVVTGSGGAQCAAKGKEVSHLGLGCVGCFKGCSDVAPVVGGELREQGRDGRLCGAWECGGQ